MFLLTLTGVDQFEYKIEPLYNLIGIPFYI